MSFQHLAQLTENPPIVLQTPDGDSWVREPYTDGYSLTNQRTHETLTINKLIKAVYPTFYEAKKRFVTPAQFLSHGFSPSIRHRVLARLIYLSNSYPYSPELAELTEPFYAHLGLYSSGTPNPMFQTYSAFKWACSDSFTAASLTCQHRALASRGALPPQVVAIVSLTPTPSGCILTTVQTHTLQDRWEAADAAITSYLSKLDKQDLQKRSTYRESRGIFLKTFFWYNNTFVSLTGDIIRNLNAIFTTRFAEIVRALIHEKAPHPPEPFPEHETMGPLTLTFTTQDLEINPYTDCAHEQNAATADASFLAAGLQPGITYNTRETGIRADRVRKWESLGYLAVVTPTPEELASIPKKRGPRPLFFRVT